MADSQTLQTALATAAPKLSVPFEELTIQVLRDLPAEQLHAIQRFQESLNKELKALGAMLHAALVARYEEQARADLQVAAKESGTVNLHDGDMKVKVEVKKSVEWDQEQLAVIAERIAAAGDDPAEWIDTKLSVSESKFKAWSRAMQDTFAPARTVKAAKSSITLARGEDL